MPARTDTRVIHVHTSRDFNERSEWCASIEFEFHRFQLEQVIYNERRAYYGEFCYFSLRSLCTFRSPPQDFLNPAQ